MATSQMKVNGLTSQFTMTATFAPVPNGGDASSYLILWSDAAFDLSLGNTTPDGTNSVSVPANSPITLQPAPTTAPQVAGTSTLMVLRG